MSEPLPRVLFVSKPVVPPWHDGSKNLVRDVAGSLKGYRPTVLTTVGTDAPPNTRGWPVYGGAGAFAPALSENARVLSALSRARGFAVWHFVFAPNPVSSAAAHAAISVGRLRGVQRVVQTVASRPKRFVGLRALLFGDVVVALSEWTRGRLLASGADGKKLVVIPPCAATPREVSDVERASLRRELDVEPSAPLVVYAGDLEISSGAETTAGAVHDIVRHVPEARVIFACRKKTERAAFAEERLRAGFARSGLAHAVRFAGELPDLAALIREAAVMVFPVDDLYGKVDVPLVVIEALAVGTPLVLARGGPLETVRVARFVEPREPAALAVEVGAVLDGGDQDWVAGKSLYAELFTPEAVARRYEEIYAR